jgi:hypothetical protein
MSQRERSGKARCLSEPSSGSKEGPPGSQGSLGSQPTHRPPRRAEGRSRQARDFLGFMEHVLKNKARTAPLLFPRPPPPSSPASSLEPVHSVTRPSPSNSGCSIRTTLTILVSIQPASGPPADVADATDAPTQNKCLVCAARNHPVLPPTTQVPRCLPAPPPRNSIHYQVP